VFRTYGVARVEIEPIVVGLKRNPKGWVDFMMRFDLGLEEPDPGRALRSALAIASAYVAGGLVPLWPYMVNTSARGALQVSVIVTILSLGFFGYVKSRFTGARPLRGALQTALIGGLAAGVAFLIARLVTCFTRTHDD